MMPLEDRWQKWKDWEEEEHSFLWFEQKIILGAKEEAEDRESLKRKFITRT